MRSVAMTSIGMALLMAALCAGELIPYLGPFFGEFRPVAAFFLYFGLGFLMGDAYSEATARRRGLLLTVALAGHLLLFATPFVAGYYILPAKVAAAAKKNNDGKDLKYSDAAVSTRVFLEKETECHGVAAYAIYSMRQSMEASNAGEHVAHQFEGVDGLGSCLAALINIVLYTIPIALKWLLVSKLHVVGDPAYIGLAFWYLVALAFSFFGLREGME